MKTFRDIVEFFDLRSVIVVCRILSKNYAKAIFSLDRTAKMMKCA